MKQSALVACLGFILCASSYAAEVKIRCSQDDVRVPARLSIAQGDNDRAVVTLLEEGKPPVTMHGKYSLVRDSQFNKLYKFDLSSPKAKMPLWVSWYKQERRCTRVSCDPEKFSGIEAIMRVGQEEVFFTCHEVS